MKSALAVAIFWIAVACFVVAQLAILRSVLASREAPSAAGRGARRSMEIVWAVLPALALAVVVVITWRAIQSGREATVTAQSSGIGQAVVR